MPPPPSVFADALVLTGPTGSGKSAFALALAPKLGAEIVALDSMTLYRGMDIGTAKPTVAERTAVPHHLIDVLDPWESGNVAWWLDRAAEACFEIRGRGRRPLFVGGTPFYLKALLHGLFDAPPANAEIRERLEREAADSGPEALHARLAAVDAVTATRLHPNDVRRVVRALEVFEATGSPISALQQTWAEPALPLPAVALQWPRDELNRRIDARVDAMLAAGWLDEARRLRELPHPLSPEASRALGYPELFAFLDGQSPWDETADRIRLRTRQFAKRQRTWFRGLNLATVAADAPDLPDLVERAFAHAATAPGR